MKHPYSASNVKNTFRLLHILIVELLGKNTFCQRFTVWKCQDFPGIQILREINFGAFRMSKNAVFAIFWTSEFC